MSRRLTENITNKYISAASQLRPKNAKRKVVVYVESYDDILFWHTVFTEIKSPDRYFEVMLPSRTSLGKGKKVPPLRPIGIDGTGKSAQRDRPFVIVPINVPVTNGARCTQDRLRLVLDQLFAYTLVLRGAQSSLIDIILHGITVREAVPRLSLLYSHIQIKWGLGKAYSPTLP